MWLLFFWFPSIYIYICRHSLTSKVTSSIPQSSANITDSNQNNTVDASFAHRLSSVSGIDLQVCENDHFTTAVSTDNSSKTSSKKPIKCTKEKQNLNTSNFDHLCTTGYKITTADFEQAAHLNAQYRYMAYIQSLFSPLLESVGLSIKVSCLLISFRWFCD